MKEYQELYDVAVRTARGVGKILRDGFVKQKRANEISSHDVKLEMDVRCQEYIYRTVGRAFPEHAFLGEEDNAYHGGRKATTEQPEFRWVVDPLDGTVNYFYGIPHYCTSIACQRRRKALGTQDSGLRTAAWKTVVGVVYDPSTDELFSTQRGGPSYLNGQRIRVSPRSRLSDCCVTIGLFKSPKTIAYGNIHFAKLSRKAKKIRIMGAAALDICYVASGRYDAYLELSIKLWDIAAGLFILENAGGTYKLSPTEQPNSFECVATNGKILKDYRFFTKQQT